MMRKRGSLIFSLTILFGVLLALLLLAIGFYSIFSIKIVNENTNNQMQANMDLMTSNANSKLELSTSIISEFITDSMDQIFSYENQSPTGQQVLQLLWQDKLNNRMTYSNSCDFLFISHSGSYPIQISYSSKITSSQRLSIIDYFATQPKLESSNGWALKQIGDIWYLVQNIDLYNCSVGAGIKLSSLFYGSLLDCSYIVKNTNGQILYQNGASFSPKRSDYQITKSFGEVSFTIRKQKSGILLNMNRDFYFALLFVFLGFCFFLFLAFFLNKKILTPINNLHFGMTQLENGNFSHVVPSEGNTNEMDDLITSFNKMTLQIKHSKDLELQTSLNAFRFLKMQIRPHFYLNAITTMSSLAYQNEGEKLQQFSQALSQYIRYLLDKEGDQSTIFEELNHTEEFVNLYKIREPEHIVFILARDPQAETIIIPRFLILTAVENALKHAVRKDSTFTLCVSTAINNNMLEIEIQDNGPGFTDSYLSSPFSQTSSENEQIGLANIKTILDLKYKGEAQMLLSNSDSGGAKVFYKLPIKEVSDAGSSSR